MNTEVLRARHYSLRTEEAYVHWIRRFLLFHDRAHPSSLAEDDVNRFLTHLAAQQNVAASTQNQALAGLLFLYEHVLEQPLNRIAGVGTGAPAPAASGGVEPGGGRGGSGRVGGGPLSGVRAAVRL